MPTCYSIFSGGGVADAGYVSAGYEILGGIESDPAIARVYQANYGHCLVKRVETVILDELPKHADLVHVSPPCTNYSNAKIDPDPSYQDAGPAILPIIKRLQPSAIVLENVYPYQASKGYQELCQGLKDQGYFLDLHRIYCPRYGIPQTRKRLICVWTQQPFSLQLPLTNTYCGWYEVLKDDFLSFPLSPMSPQLWSVCGDDLRNKYIHPWTEPALIDRTGRRKQTNSISFKKPHEPAFTVRASCATQLLIVHRGMRRLTMRAYAKLQTIPDWYLLPSAQGLAKRVIGNGVPSQLTNLIGKALLPVL